jgi:hypothetical protein
MRRIKMKFLFIEFQEYLKKLSAEATETFKMWKFFVPRNDFKAPI